MNRTSIVNALVLSLKQVGESNRLVTLFTKEDGIITAMLYGGPKSRLRALVSPYHTGRMWLYRDTVRNTVKINDFDVTSFRPSLRENLYKLWASSLCAELLIKTCARGETLFTLANGFLDGLDLSNEEECKLGTIRFLWRMQGELGTQCDVSRCIRCDVPLISGPLISGPPISKPLLHSRGDESHPKSRLKTNAPYDSQNEQQTPDASDAEKGNIIEESASSTMPFSDEARHEQQKAQTTTHQNEYIAYYVESESGFLCPACHRTHRLHGTTTVPTEPSESGSGASGRETSSKMSTLPYTRTRGRQTEQTFSLTSECVRYLQALNALTPKEVRKIRISGETFGTLQELVFFLSEKSCDGKIKTLENTRFIW